MEVELNQMTTSTQIVKVGSVQIGGPDFVVIAGPCSIESYDQLKATAFGVRKQGAQLLRGGIWKIRTNSESFQGLGKDSFEMIKKVLSETQMQLVSEVTDPRHIEQLDDVVGMYQVGSRNMHNTSLLKELGMSRKPILLKRGFASLIDEWIKAADYLRKGGNDQIILCERGIRTFETATRNTLDLNAVIYLKKRTNLPVIVDPSHAVGIRDLVADAALAAAAAGADGLIVEVHPQPEKALSDGMQTLNLEEFAAMMTKLRKILDAIDRPLHQVESLAH